MEKSGIPEAEFFFRMPDGLTVNLNDTLSLFQDIWSENWANVQALMVDSYNSLTLAAEEILDKEKINVVTMGHTHAPLMHSVSFKEGAVYVNSGFNSPTQPDMETGYHYPTFVEVAELDDNNTQVTLQKVDIRTNSISPLFSVRV